MAAPRGAPRRDDRGCGHCRRAPHRRPAGVRRLDPQFRPRSSSRWIWTALHAVDRPVLSKLGVEPGQLVGANLFEVYGDDDTRCSR